MTDTPEASFAFGEALPDARTASGSAAGASKPATRETVLDRLRGKTMATAQAATIVLPIPARTDTGLSMRYATYLPADRYERIIADNDGDITATRIDVLIELCRGLLIDGELVDDGELTFGSPVLRGMLDQAVTATQAVRRLYLRDGDIGRTCDTLLRACGWDMAARLDPIEP